MLYKLLGVVVPLSLPALLVGQAPAAPTTVTTKAMPAPRHGIATQVRGEVATPPQLRVEEPDGQNNQEGVDEADGQNNQDGVDELDGQNNQEGVDEPNGPNNQEGVDEPDGPNNEVGEQGNQGDQDQGTANPAPPQGTARNNRIGRHRP